MVIGILIKIRTFNLINNLTNPFDFQINFKSDSNYEKDLYVDAANGIGAMKIKALAEIIKSDSIFKNNNNKNLNSEKQMNITVFNDGTAADDVLNHNVS